MTVSNTDFASDKERRGPTVIALQRRIATLENLDELVALFGETDWSQVTGPPDHWYNIGTRFSSFDLDDEALLIFEEGLKEHPQAVDLLCSVFQLQYGVASDLAAAGKCWEGLKKIESRKTSWRYYAYGARFLAILGKKGGHQLLVEGIELVPVKDIANLYVALAKQSFFEPLSSEDDEVDALLLEGVRRPIRLGHLLALELSRRTQRRSASETDQLKRQETLEQALEYAALALALYTDPGERNNHPVEEIYYQQAQLLVALKRYGEALQRLRAIERASDFRMKHREEWYDTVKPTRIFCEQMTGGASAERGRW